MENKGRNSSTAGFALRAIEGTISGLLQTAVSLQGNLTSEIDRFHMVREKTLNILGKLTAEQAAWTPRAGSWSIVQIADHLLRSEELYRTQFRRLIEVAGHGKSSTIRIDLREIDTSVAGIPRDVMSFFEAPVRIFSRFVPNAVRETLIRYPVVPALNPNIAEPRSGLTPEKLTADLTAALVETESLLRAPMPPMIDGPTIDHPLMGRNNLRVLFRIMIAHEERHLGQMESLQSHPRWPKASQP